MINTEVSQPLHGIKRNRVFNCNMRNLYYEKANYQFRKLNKKIQSKNPLSEHEQLPDIYDFLEKLNACMIYADLAVYPSKKELISNYADDRHFGILQEEFLLIYFLEKQISSTEYIINHIEINKQLQSYEEKNKALRHVLANIEAFKKHNTEDLRHLYKGIENRYEIGNRLFGVLQELQNFQ